MSEDLAAVGRCLNEAGTLKQKRHTGWWTAGVHHPAAASSPGRGQGTEPRSSGPGPQASGFGDSEVTLPGVREQGCGPKLGCRDSGVGTRDPRFERLL